MTHNSPYSGFLFPLRISPDSLGTTIFVKKCTRQVQFKILLINIL